MPDAGQANDGSGESPMNKMFEDYCIFQRIQQGLQKTTYQSPLLIPKGKSDVFPPATLPESETYLDEEGRSQSKRCSAKHQEVSS